MVSWTASIAVLKIFKYAFHHPPSVWAAASVAASAVAAAASANNWLNDDVKADADAAASRSVTVVVEATMWLTNESMSATGGGTTARRLADPFLSLVRDVRCEQ